MEWFFYIIVIVCLIDIEEKLKKLMNNNYNLDSRKENNNKMVLEQYLNKEVYIVMNDDAEISDQHLFSAGGKTIGKITDYDSTWILFEYYNKNKKETIHRYIKIKDLKSIDEVN